MYNYLLAVSTKPYDFKDKEKCLNDFVRYTLDRTQQMFVYEGLPDTVSQRDLELLMQTSGFTCWLKYDNDIYALYGTLGGLPNQYNMPTECIISNPYLELNDTYIIDKDCVIMPNDSTYQGLLPLISKYGTLLVENELTMKLATINTRIQQLISAGDDRTKSSAEEYLKKIEDGKLGVIADNAFLESLIVNNLTNSNSAITNIIELEQYLKASLFNELGINSNYNMKRESLNSNESQLNDDMLKPLVDNMLECRRTSIEKINKMFGLNITVDLNSSWKDNEIATELELDNIDADGDQEEIVEESTDIDEPTEETVEEEETEEQKDEEKEKDEDDMEEKEK